MLDSQPNVGKLSSQGESAEPKKRRELSPEERRARAERLREGRRLARERRLQAEAAEAAAGSAAPIESGTAEVVDPAEVRAEATPPQPDKVRYTPEGIPDSGISEERIREITQPKERLVPAESFTVDLSHGSPATDTDPMTRPEKPLKLKFGAAKTFFHALGVILGNKWFKGRDRQE